jgi:Ca2+-transporting ATPase
VLTAALIPFAGFPLLYLPAHIVWLELIIHPTAILAFQQIAPRGVLEAADGRPADRFFDRREWLVIGIVGTLLTLAVIAGYVRGLGVGEDVAHARSIALAMLVLASAAVTVGLSRLRGRLAWGLAITATASAILLIQSAAIARLLHLSPLRAQDWLFAAATAVTAGALAALLARAPVRQRA